MVKTKKLPLKPDRYYPNFPGWIVFLGKVNKHNRVYYETWQEASFAVKKMKMSNRIDYENRYKKDKKLPSAPYDIYSDFPGWDKFLGKL